jgi:Kdo2-lipid A phosphotransferase
MKIKSLLFCHLFIVLLLSTFLCPTTKVLWSKLDLWFFHFLNDPMENRRWLQYFWAFANHKNADWVEDVVFFALSFLYVMRPSDKPKARKIAEIIFCIFVISMIILFINRIFFHEQLRILRDSPTIIVESCVRISYEIPWMSIKDISAKCFPADHATTALLFGSMYSFLAKRWLRAIAIIYCAFLCLPRMAVGAHWLSDALVGSGTIVLFSLSWTYCLPIRTSIISWLERFICFFQRKKINSRV